MFENFPTSVINETVAIKLYINRFTVQKEGANKGRPFYVCAKPQQDSRRCSFFMWADGDAGQSRQNFRNQNNNFGDRPSGSNYQRRSNFKARKTSRHTIIQEY